MTTILGVDLGKTGCRAALWSAQQPGVPLARAAGEGAPGLAAEHGVEQAYRRVLDVLAEVERAAPDRAVDVISLGCAGAEAAPAAVEALSAQLASRCPGADVVVASDAITAHAGALAGEAGVVLSAGTGAVVVGVGSDGAVVQVDGWGPWLGDDGSGAWIGREALAAVLRALDGRGPATSLSAAASSVYGPDLRSLPVAVTGAGHPARTVAAFAPAVAAAAEAGDAVAKALLHRAAAALAAGVVTAARRLITSGEPPRAGETLRAAERVRPVQPVPAVLIGGLLLLGPPLLDPLTEQLAAADVPLDLRPPRGGALDGARLFAQRRDTPHEVRLVRRAGAGVAS